MGLCITPDCGRMAAQSKGHSNGRCNACRAAREKARDLIGWAFRKLKSNAKRRGIFFDLTREQFAAFCYETQILHGRGRTSQSYHVDRIIDERGYTAGNLQKLTNRENLAKEMSRRKLVAWVDATHEHEKGIIKMIDVTPSPPDPDCPF